MHVSICPRCKSKLWNVPPRTAQERRHYREAQRRRLTKKGGA
jgi:hypothetical protein